MSDEQFSKLSKQVSDFKADVAERLDKQDAKVDKRLDKQDIKIDKLDDVLLKIYRHAEERFDKIEAELDGKADKKDLGRIYDALDAILKNQEIEQQERAAILRQLERHERWHHQTAEHIGLKLNYEAS